MAVDERLGQADTEQGVEAKIVHSGPAFVHPRFDCGIGQFQVVRAAVIAERCAHAAPIVAERAGDETDLANSDECQ